MSLRTFVDKVDLWLREENHKNLKKRADKLELDAKFAKINAPYKKRINTAKDTIKKHTPKRDPLDMSLEL